MLDIGWWELFVIGMVALVVVGPNELPTLLRTIGRYVGMAKRQADEFRAQFDEAMRESEFNDLKKQMEDIKSDVTSSIDDAQHSIHKELSDIDDKSGKSPGDEYDWDADGPIEPAAEFADDKPTTSFTMADGTVVTKTDEIEASETPAVTRAATPETETQTASSEVVDGDTAAKDGTADKVASTRNAESVR